MNQTLASLVVLCVACGPSASPSSGTAVAPVAPAESNAEPATPTVLVKDSAEEAPKPAPGPKPVVAPQKRSLLLGTLSGPNSEVFGTGNANEGPSPISVSLGVTKISGGLDKPEAERILRLAQDAFRDCASDMQRGRHEFTITFRVSPKGALSRAKVAGTDSPVRSCVSKVLGRLVFPDARKPSTVAAKLDVKNSTALLGVLSGGYGQKGGMAHRMPSPAGGLRVAQFKSIGPLNGAIIRRILLSKKPRLDLCYQRWSMHISPINNRVTMEFLVKPDGNVGQFKVKAPIQPIEQCIRSIMNTARFPAIASGATRVVHSITLPPRVKKP